MIKFNNKTSCDQEGDFNHPRILSDHNNQTSRGSSSGFKNPRIVRVSRDYGGKDRHSKVWTVKGLKDRRIRLSIPTAIQLYDLQDKLGLSQPSKVIDWLLDVTKDDIDKLPPLQIALEDFHQFHQNLDSPQLPFPPFFFNSPNYDHQRTKGKETAVENKSNCSIYKEFQPSNNLSLSRFGHQIDTANYASLLPSSLNTNYSQSEPIISPSFCPPYFMHNHFNLLTPNSPNMHLPINLNDSTQAKVLFGLHMKNSKASSESKDIG